ncbi:unnamed protein product, partial [Rotaria sp. Silwood2]
MGLFYEKAYGDVSTALKYYNNAYELKTQIPLD